MANTYDLVAFRGTLGAGEVLTTQVLALPNDGGAYCTGIVKLVQRFLIELMTDEGSVLYEPTRGCTFMSRLRTGRIRTETDLIVAFALSVGTIGRNLQVLELATDPDDERFQSAEILALALLPGQARLTINITSAAGSARPVILPLSTPV